MAKNTDVKATPSANMPADGSVPASPSSNTVPAMPIPTTPQPSAEDLLHQMDVAGRIFNEGLAQQNALAHQQAMNHLRLAAVGKCAQLILNIDPLSPNASELLKQYKELIDLFMEKFDPARS